MNIDNVNIASVLLHEIENFEDNLSYLKGARTLSIQNSGRSVLYTKEDNDFTNILKTLAIAHLENEIKKRKEQIESL